MPYSEEFDLGYRAPQSLHVASMTFSLDRLSCRLHTVLSHSMGLNSLDPLVHPLTDRCSNKRIRVIIFSSIHSYFILFFWARDHPIFELCFVFAWNMYPSVESTTSHSLPTSESIYFLVILLLIHSFSLHTTPQSMTRRRHTDRFLYILSSVYYPSSKSKSLGVFK